ncbi:hypothetical protein UA08_02882 [Talaromyces atroroseus]|uniref:Cupin type-2 domain-containing protein n=1 Tax=Talaromyces atroroseus TaxID=1441469 RepID=A0A225B5S3_TALAT|nr:hypothetical protein UA08_02882 [Talaromyces atroroseus]OKL62215.1 hypothetical protein UA08_02882 [Talaromyces atroroseus]
MEIPDRPVSFVPAKAGDVLTLGTMTLRVMEDGSNTDMRLSSVELIVPPNTRGPPPHWHEMHDETFLITKGTIRFHIPPAGPDGKRKPAEIIDAQAGDYVVVPTRSPHTFSNPTDAEARFFNTFTPAFYINYFKLLAELSDEARPLTKEANQRAMAYYATLPVPEM